MFKYLNKNKKTILGIVLIVILACILAFMIFIVKFMLNMQHAEKQSYHPSDDKRQQSVSIAQKNNKNISFLILGLDKKDSGAQRTDSIIIATYNPKKNKVVMTRIPRDLYIKTDNYEGKINALYETHGLSEVINVLQDYLGIPISNYGITDFNGLTKVIDHIGGVDINSDIEIDKSNNYNIGKDVFVKKGNNHLNGKEALAYSRIRYIDNDIERGNRQMQVVKAIGYKLFSPGQIVSVDDNINFMSKYIKTDMKISTAVGYLNSASGMPEVEQLKFKWSGFNYNNQDYVYVTNEERAKISSSLRDNLDLDKKGAMIPMQLEPEKVNK